jgi:hypothetical protein
MKCDQQETRRYLAQYLRRLLRLEGEWTQLLLQIEQARRDVEELDAALKKLGCQRRHQAFPTKPDS